MKIRKLTNEEIKGACAFAVSIYNIAIRNLLSDTGQSSIF